MKRALTAVVLSVGLIVLSGPWSVAIADDDDDDNDNRLQAVPATFVGKAGDCGTAYPAGSRIVTSAWLGGMGLPDNGGQNVGSDPKDNPSKQDPHLGLLLSKNGTTADCSAAEAEITGVTGIEVTADFHLGFDYRNGGHCGAGAPRFDVSYRQPDGNDASSFVGGCSNDHQPITAPQDPAQWTRVRFQTSDPTESFPTIPTGSTIKRITLIFDEGTDSPGNPSTVDPFDDPSGIGLAVVDNIDINGRLITRGTGIADGIDRYKKKHDRD